MYDLFLINFKIINFSIYFYFQELVGSKKGFNISKLGIILAAVVFIVLIIVVSVLLTNEGTNESNYASSKEAQNGDLLSLEDIIDGRVNGHRFNGTILSANEFMFRDPNDRTKIYNIDTGKVQEILSKDHEGIKEDLSPDRKYMLVAIDVHKVCYKN